MHFIDFLLHLICFICWMLKTIYIFSIDYLIPIIGHIIPVFVKYLSQLFAFLLRIFFTYISPCVIQLLNGTTYIFTRALNALSGASMTIIESDVNLEYAHAILMATILVIIIYFHITEKIARFFVGWYQIISLYLRFLANILKMLRFCLSFSYRSIKALLFGRAKDSNDDETITSKKEVHHHQNNHNQRNRKLQENGVNGISLLNGSKSN